MVRIHDSPDARELDDFKRCLQGAGLALRWIHNMPRAKLDVYRIIPGKIDESWLNP